MQSAHPFQWPTSGSSFHIEVFRGHSHPRIKYLMYIIAIAWLYFVIMMAIVSDSIVVGLLRFVFLGAIPAGLLLWMALRRRRAQNEQIKEDADAKNRDSDADSAAVSERKPDSNP